MIRAMSSMDPHVDPADALLAFIEQRGAAPLRSVLVVAAHPDDEVIGAGALLTRLATARVVIDLVHVTDGAPRNMVDASAAGFVDPESYARQRRRELYAALHAGGIAVRSAGMLGVPDQQASLSLEPLARRLARVLEVIRPAVVLTHPYEGGHPDHDATAFAVHAATAAWASSVVEFSCYHGAGGTLHPLEFLPGVQRNTALCLSPAERTAKRAMVDRFVTQQRTLAPFPLGVECFRRAPRYDFTKPPHDGRLFFEHFHWGMNGDEWRDHARAAQRALALRRPPWRGPS
jgi:LmbE family N-acetylglucosaminyl deacetylase